MNSNKDATMIRLNKVSKTYRTDKVETLALKDIDLHVGQGEFVAMMGNVKAFILSICSAVVFATLLVSANTMAMSIRERTREVALLKTRTVEPASAVPLRVA